MEMKVEGIRIEGSGSGKAIYEEAVKQPEVKAAMMAEAGRKAGELSASASAAAHSPMPEAFMAVWREGVPNAQVAAVVAPTFKGAQNVANAHGLFHW